eukprot:357806-Chlamydomonas_euryale.AAC.4
MNASRRPACSLAVGLPHRQSARRSSNAARSATMSSDPARWPRLWHSDLPYRCAAMQRSAPRMACSSKTLSGRVGLEGGA